MQEMIGIIEQAGAMFKDLITLQKKYLDNLKKEPETDYSNREIVQSLNAGETVLGHCGLKLDTAICKELQQDICRLIAKHRTGKEGLIEKVGAYISDSQDIYEAFLKDRGLAMPEEVSLEEKEMMNFILAQTLRPFLQAFACQYRTFIEQEQWLRDYCPVCGEKAAISYLRAEDGRRMLVCLQCGTEWLYKYLACSWCGNEDHHDLSFFEATEVPGYEVYLCEKCHGYLKTYNEKKRSERLDWPLEDIGTITLDILAMSMGYSNHGHRAYM
jgi:FdhE protein